MHNAITYIKESILPRKIQDNNSTNEILNSNRQIRNEQSQEMIKKIKKDFDGIKRNKSSKEK